MRTLFDLEKFINQYVTRRGVSMFEADMRENRVALSEAVKDKSILVIGGAGSIGLNFIRTVLPFCPRELCVVDINENALTELTRNLRAGGFLVPPIYLPYPMDYRSPIFKRFFVKHEGFDIVANFSAYKHVRSERDVYGVEALLRNNVINVKGLLDLMSAFPPESYFCVSTDKAANPVNVMGASKRLMERLVFAYSDIFPVKTARFANVAFSNGSLPAGFLERISRGQPISAPIDIKRYFVSPKESGQICMLAAMLGGNREIFFPKLKAAEMMTFDKIAESLLKEFGYELFYCKSEKEAMEMTGRLKNGSKLYPVCFSISDTSGEKEFEEFYEDGEMVDMGRFQGLGVVMGAERPDKKCVIDVLETLEEAFGRGADKYDIIQIISDYLPEFKHIETGKSLDGKM